MAESMKRSLKIDEENGYGIKIENIFYFYSVTIATFVELYSGN